VFNKTKIQLVLIYLVVSFLGAALQILSLPVFAQQNLSGESATEPSVISPAPTSSIAPITPTAPAMPILRPWKARFQSTYVWQSKRPFSAAYSGPNSLLPAYEKSYSFTATGFLGAHL